MTLAVILLTAFINLLLGIISYKKNPNSATNRLLTGLTVIFALWTTANYFSLHSATEEATLFWIRAVMFITAPLGPLLYLFIKTFPSRKLKANKFERYFLIITTLVVQAIAFTPWLFSSVTVGEQVTPTPEPGLILFALLFVGAPLASMVVLIKKYKRTTGIERLQLRYLVFGTLLTFILLIITNFLLVVLFNYSQFVIFGPMFSLIFVGFIFYAIVKHRLMQVRLIIARSVAYTLLVAILVTIYSLGVSLITTYVLDEVVENRQRIAIVILTVIIVFTFVPLKNLIEKITDRIFFQHAYKTEETLFELTTLIASTINLKVLTKNILQKLIQVLRIEQGIFVIYRKNNKYSMVYEGYRVRPQLKKEQFNKLFPQQHLIVAEEETDRELRKVIQKMGIQIVIPLSEHDQSEGVLLLGAKKSGEIYPPQDIKLLEIIRPILTIAVQNAKAYEEIKTFNKTLTDRVELATKELQISHHKLQTIDKQKDQFIGMASHELKTPITSIKAFTQVLMQKSLNDKNVDYAHLLKNINNQIDRITNLINDLLNVSNIEAGRLILKKKEVDFDSFITDVITNLQYTTDKHKLVKEGQTKRRIKIDEDRIEQVLSNLLTNAIKYSPGTDQIIIKLANSKDQVTVTITDMGPGIPEEEQQKIFERFYRTREQEKNNITGFGLGLYISAEIIKKHKGKIWVKSKKGQGSTFGFSLPLS